MSYLTFKIVVVGEPQMGKTTLVQTIESNKSPEKGYKATIGVNYVSANCTAGKRQVTLQLWDIAGQERLMKNLRMYYEHAYLALIVVSVEKAETILSNESSVERQIEFFRTTDYVIPNSSRILPLGLVISKWDMASKLDNPEELKKKLISYGKAKGFEFTAFTSVFDEGLTSVHELKDSIVQTCLAISNSQTLRIQFLGSMRAVEKLTRIIKKDYDSSSQSDSYSSGRISIPLGKLTGTEKVVELDARTNAIPMKAPLYSEPNVVGTTLVLSAEDFADKAAGSEITQRLINYTSDTRGMKVHNHDEFLRRCIILLDGCSQSISAKDMATLTSFKDVKIKQFKPDASKEEIVNFMLEMAKEWNAVFYEDDFGDGDDVDLDLTPETSDNGQAQSATHGSRGGGCQCGKH